MENNQKFLESFNLIEGVLKNQINDSTYKNFRSLIIENSKDKIVKKYEEELKLMGDLRNILVHKNNKNPPCIVTDQLLERINHIYNLLTMPKKITDLFSKNVTGVDEKDSLAKVLKDIKEYRYSQFPVSNEEGFIGLITENGITNWLANNIHEDVISIQDTIIKNIILEDDERNSYGVLYATDSLYDVLEKFEEKSHSSERIFAVIIFNQKKKKFLLEDIYTIITLWDLKNIYSYLNLNS